MRRLNRLLSVIGLSAASLGTAGCNEETTLLFRDAVVNGAVTFLEAATIALLEDAFGQSTTTP